MLEKCLVHFGVSQDAVTQMTRQAHLDRGALLQIVLRTRIRIRKSLFCEGGARDAINTVGMNK